MGAEGYFPAGGSLLRKVHEEKLVGLFYGQRALCIGALKPLNYVGTSEHTRERLTPFHRLARTGGAFETVFFGTRAQADKTLEAVRTMHERVVGTLPLDAGPHYPAGTPYAANDPQLMLWTIAVIADSACWFYEHLIGGLSAEEHEALWQDYLLLGELFGMSCQGAPASFSEFRSWYEEQLAGEDLHLTDEARYMGHATAFAIPMPPGRWPVKCIHDIVMLGSLPARVRELYGLCYTPAHALAHSAAVQSIRAARRLTPGPLMRGSCAAEFALVADTERRRIERGESTPQLEL